LGTFRTPKIEYDRLHFHRHHVIPSQVISCMAFLPFFLSLQCLGFNPQDFATNGILLPCTEQAAVESRLPLHRGPHRHYNELVGDRVAMLIEAHCPGPTQPVRPSEALAAVYLLQRGLQRALLQQPSFIRLNRRDPLSNGVDFRALDDEVERLWLATVTS
jgi:A nuclease family of the HNH/ENDO VII superfamily with conserved AHH